MQSSGLNMANIKEITHRDGPELSRLKRPVWRAAYSDRMAWQMSIFAELAYVKFETTSENLLEALAGDLLKLNTVADIKTSLIKFRKQLDNPNKDGKEKLKIALDAAGFELVGTFYNQSLDVLKNTEGYVAKRNQGDGHDFAVLAIRGTTSPQDWIKNAKVGLKSIGGGRQVHSGFSEAFDDGKDQIEELLKSLDSLPLYITGHSLGGAVAVMATWYFKRDTLAACYTFGAPRVGNYKFNDSFRTPIYRIVNAMDPVPLVPPTDKGIACLKIISQLIGFFIGFFNKVAPLFKKIQGYRHAGDLRHMTAGEMCDDGSYPTVKFYTQFGLSDRLVRGVRLILDGELKRLDKYHRMEIYRRKLRARALQRAPK